MSPRTEKDLTLNPGHFLETNEGAKQKQKGRIHFYGTDEGKQKTKMDSFCK